MKHLSYLTLTITFFFTLFLNNSKAQTIYTITLSTQSYSTSDIASLIDAQCTGCEGNTLEDGSGNPFEIHIIIPDGVTVTLDGHWSFGSTPPPGSDVFYNNVNIYLNGDSQLDFGNKSMGLSNTSNVFIEDPDNDDALVSSPGFSPKVNFREYGNNTILATFNQGDFETIIDEGGLDINGPLPIELLYFNGKLIDDNIILNWSTAIEIDNHYFLIEESLDGISFNPVEKVLGSGNSLHKIDYQTSLPPPLGSSIVYYRITQFDYDGVSETFNIIAVDLSSSNNTFITLLPNPAKDKINIIKSGMLTDSNVLDYTIYSSQGCISKSGVAEFGSSIDITDLEPGHYSLKSVNESQVTRLNFVVEQ